VTRLAGNRSGISRLPIVVARVLGTVVSTTFAWSSVAPAVLRRAVIRRRSLPLRLVLASHDDAVLISRSACFSARLHHLLLQIGCIQEFLDPGMLLPQVLALQAIQF
jgi:hypothetical protein